jgi:phage-related tail protein
MGSGAQDARHEEFMQRARGQLRQAEEAVKQAKAQLERAEIDLEKAQKEMDIMNDIERTRD